MAARRPAPKPSAPPARPAVGPYFRAGETVTVIAGMSKGAVVPVVGPSGHRFGDIPTFEVEFPFPICNRVIRQDFLKRAS
jgi:hypothetical protein